MNNKNKTDAELVQLSLQNTDIFAEIIMRYERPLMLYIMRLLTISSGDAQDILQNVFIKIWQNLNAYNSDMPFKTWAYRITHNAAISHYRKRKSRGEEDSISFDPELYGGFSDDLEIPKNIDANMRAEQVKVTLQNIDEKYRTVLVLHYLEDISYAGISDVLKKPIGTVSSLVQRAKQKFKHQYNSLYPHTQ